MRGQMTRLLMSTNSKVQSKAISPHEMNDNIKIWQSESFSLKKFSSYETFQCEEKGASFRSKVLGSFQFPGQHIRSLKIATPS